MAVKTETKQRTPLVIYAGRYADIEAICGQMKIFHTSYLLRLLKYAFVDAGNVDPGIDWSAYGEKPFCDDTELNNLLAGISNSRKLPLLLIALFLSDGRNVKSLVERLPEGEYKLWKKCLIAGSVKESEVRRVLKISGSERIFIDKSRFSWFYPTPSSIQNVRWNWSSEKPELEFMIDPLLRPYLVAFFFPDAADFPLFDTVPEDMTLFGDEEGSLTAMMRYEAMIASSVLSFNPGYHLTMVVVRRVSAALGLKEFFPDNGGKYHQNARARIVGNMICALYDVSTLSTMTAPERARYIVRNICSYMPDFVRHVLMPQIRGKFSNTSFDFAASNTLTVIMRMLREHSGGGKWVGIKSFTDYIRLLYGSRSDLLFLDDYAADRCELNVKGEDKNASCHRIAIDERFDYLIVPLVHSVIFMLAAIGGMELAYTDRSSLSCSPFAGLAYWRVTDLGRYLLGITERYERTVEISSIDDFMLDERHLIVAVTNPGSSMRGLLDRFAKPVSTTRYAVTSESFLRHCNSKDDIQRNIELVKNFICPKPPAVWEEFFSSMLAKAEAVEADPVDYVVFKIDASDKELQRFLANDQAMRDIVICAQGFRVLVPLDKMREFKTLLLSRGYML